jgi:predicted nucleotide-binding protein (sugar kinase/HSP70/actin superfamily)
MVGFAYPKIGIPRGFYYYTYPGLWDAFFRGLDREPVFSPLSSRETAAAPVSESEHCLAHKIFDGALLSLRGKADAVFIPRVLSMTKGHICCAKFGALPDASRALLGLTLPVLMLEIDERKEPLKKTLYRFARKLGAGRGQAREAVAAGFRALDAAGEDRRRANRALPSRGRLLLLGHPYTLEDPSIAGPIRKKCGDMGIPLEIMTFEPAKLAPDPIRWCTFNKMYHKLLSLDTCCYDGVIQVSTFNCGPDSVMIDRYRRICRERGLHYLALTLDEHTGTAGIETRLEAFADSLEWKAGAAHG